MPISSISTIYSANTQPKKCAEVLELSKETKPRSYVTDVIVALLLFPTLLVLAVMVDTFIQTGWTDNVLINYCIVGLSVMFLGAIVATVCYFVIGIRNRFRRSRESSTYFGTDPSVPCLSMPAPTGVSQPPTYVQAAAVNNDEALPPTYESINGAGVAAVSESNETVSASNNGYTTTDGDMNDGNNKREFTAIAMYI